MLSDIQSRLYLLEHTSRGSISNPSSRTGASYKSKTGSPAFGKSSRLSGTTPFSSLRGYGNNSTLRQGSLTETRPTTSRINPLHMTSPLWGREGGVSESEDTLDGMSVLSSESGDLNHSACDVCVGM